MYKWPDHSHYPISFANKMQSTQDLDLLFLINISSIKLSFCPVRYLGSFSFGLVYEFQMSSASISQQKSVVRITYLITLKCFQLRFYIHTCAQNHSASDIETFRSFVLNHIVASFTYDFESPHLSIVNQSRNCKCIIYSPILEKTHESNINTHHIFIDK